MGILHKLFDIKFDDDAPLFDAWNGFDIDEGKVRNLIKVRIRYLNNVNPYSPDLDDLLWDIIHNDRQREAIKYIWFDEATKALSQEE